MLLFCLGRGSDKRGTEMERADNKPAIADVTVCF